MASRGQSVKSPSICSREGCGRYALQGGEFCHDCTPHNSKRFRAAMYRFKNREVQTAFEMMLKSDERFSLDNELALLRTCLAAAVAKCDAEKLEQMGPHSIAAITTLAAEVGRMCDIMSRLEQKFATHVPLEVLLFFIQLMAETITKHVDEDTAETCVSAILELPLPQANNELGKRILARGTLDPSNAGRKALKERFADRKDKIASLRAQADALRKEIEEAGGHLETDEELAPPEPVEDSDSEE